jgi:hypothetical protein
MTAVQQWWFSGGKRAAPVTPVRKLDIDALLAFSTASTAALYHPAGVMAGFNPAKAYEVTLNSDTYLAWNEATVLDGVPWRVRVRWTAGGIDHDTNALGFGATAALAHVEFVPFTMTGYDTYQLWIPDSANGDNRGGLSLTITELP